MDEPETIKVVLLGEADAGKQGFLSCLNEDKFDPHCETSLRAQFTSKTLEFPDLGQSIKFDIWDTVEKEKYPSLTKIFYKDAKVIILIYDITSESSFEALKNFWYKDANYNKDNNPIFAVVANKNLYDKQRVSIQEGKEFADKIGAIFQVFSPRLNAGISTLFDNIGKTYLIPGYDYKVGYPKEQEEFTKKNKNEKNQREKGIVDSKIYKYFSY